MGTTQLVEDTGTGSVHLNPATIAPASAQKKRSRWQSLTKSVGAWFDSGVMPEGVAEFPDFKIDWWRTLPFILLHLSCLTVLLVGWSWVAVGVAVSLYVIRMFAITGFYHRYFSHRTFRTSRFMQFVFAVVGNSSVQRGPLWWAAHHRHHHRHSDENRDQHSAARHGFLWSHIGWIMSKRNFPTDIRGVQDLAKFPELRFLDRFDNLVPLVFGVSLFLAGWASEIYAPGLGTSRWQMLVWGFCISTVVCMHATFSINSLTHMFGSKRYRSKDESRNNLWLALITLGEGWHNNHHYYPGAARQGFYWWEIDITYYGLWLMSKIGLIWDLNPVPREVREANKLPA